MNDCLDYLGRILSTKAVLLETLPSAQQEAVVVSIDRSTEDSSIVYPTDEWKEALDDPTSRESKLIIRRWLRTCRWWNLHADHSSTTDGAASASASASFSAINVGADAFQTRPKTLSTVDMAAWEIAGYRVARCALDRKVPRVLYSSLDDDNVRNDDGALARVPWAVLEYIPTEMAYNGWIDGMVKVRHEFGFDEPHPRWGRVPVEQSLSYALVILAQVVLPLHAYCREKRHCANHRAMISHLSGFKRESQGGITFKDQIHTCLIAHGNMMVQDDKSSPELTKSIYLLEGVIQKLDQCNVDALPPVLCHMDYQPQNVQFASDSTVAAVFDWEEAAYADPRFDVLLVCRKVCAKREQAQIVWEKYRETAQLPLGPLDPWLRLETTHSLTTLLLQAMDLQGGGRSPWESKPDLWGKIEREIARLSQPPCE